MARTHGKILCTIWHDDDFLKLSTDAQRLYLVILSQPKLNLVGMLDYFPGRLARLSTSTSIADVETTIAELEATRFVIVDRHTDELLVRSFTKNDPIQFANSKLRKGLWSAWQAIDSDLIRSEAVWAMPDPIFDHPEVPGAARHIRTSGRTEPPTDPAPIAQSNEEPPDRAIEPRTDTPPPPPPPPPPPATSAARPERSTPVDKSEPPNPSSQIPTFTADDVELIDDQERELGLTIAQAIRARIDHIDPEHQDDHQDQHA